MTYNKDTQMRKGILTACILLTLLSGIVYISAFQLPDNSPIITFTSSTSDTDTVAVLTTVSVDTLTNAGIKWIEIYENNNLLDRKECDSSTCVFVKTIVKTQAGTFSYYAKTLDNGDHTVTSGTITIKFNGTAYASNSRPEIEEISSWFKLNFLWSLTWLLSGADFEITKNRILVINPTVEDADTSKGDSLSYRWFVDDAEVSTSSKFEHLFGSSGLHDVNLVVADKYGATAVKNWKVSVKEPNLYGNVINTDGMALAGENISFYPASTYDVENANNTEGYEQLKQKAIPDTMTDANGYYDINLPYGEWHMVIQGSYEVDFNIQSSSVEKEHDVEVNCNQPTVNFNAEGHIIHSGGENENGNKYACGQKVEFSMFGVNNGQTNENITFMVESHVAGNGVEKYRGNISNNDESLTVPAGQKIWKRFYFEVPCSYDVGRYDIHVIWNNESWHKIGNFFVISDTTLPTISFVKCWNSEVCPVYTNQTATFEYHASDPVQSGTIPDVYIIQMQFPQYIEVEMTASSSDGRIFNLTTANGTLKDNSFNITFNQSGHYTINATVKDKAGNTASASINVSVYATEEEADAIGTAVYNQYGLTLSYDLYREVHTNAAYNSTATWDRWDDTFLYGDEYISSAGDLNDLNTTEIYFLDEGIYDNIPGFAKGIYAMTASEYNYSINSFFYTIKCAVNHSELYGMGPACNSRNFVPEIWDYNPKINPTINSNSSSNFQISAGEPNGDAYSIYWYDNNQLVATNSTNWTFVSNPGNIGSHIIKAVASDSSGENVTILSNLISDKDFIALTNIRTWNLTVTA